MKERKTVNHGIPMTELIAEKIDQDMLMDVVLTSDFIAMNGGFMPYYLPYSYAEFSRYYTMENQSHLIIKPPIYLN